MEQRPRTSAHKKQNSEDTLRTLTKGFWEEPPRKALGALEAVRASVRRRFSSIPRPRRRRLLTFLGASALTFSVAAIWAAVTDSGLNRRAAPIGTTSTSEAPDILGPVEDLLEPAEDDPGWDYRLHGDRRGAPSADGDRTRLAPREPADAGDEPIEAPQETAQAAPRPAPAPRTSTTVGTPETTTGTPPTTIQEPWHPPIEDPEPPPTTASTLLPEPTTTVPTTVEEETGHGHGPRSR